MKIFESARIKLTAWYLVLIMSVTLTFSAAIYISVSRSSRLAVRLHTERLETQIRKLKGLSDKYKFQDSDNRETIRDINQRTLYNLGVINILIFFVAGGVGYWFAGKTLRPIEMESEKQKKFIEDAAHELKTPITAMKTTLEVTLRTKKLAIEDAKETMSSIVEDIDSLDSLVRTLLKQSRYQSNMDSNSFKTLNLFGLAKGKINKMTGKAKKKDIDIILSGKKVKIKGETKGISEIITILLDNAIKFSHPKGKINISVKSDEHFGLIAVKDNGIGIDEEELPYVFDRFYKTDKSRTKDGKEGYGLGLSIVKEIVEKHKGEISVDSTLNKGSTFTIKLPK